MEESQGGKGTFATRELDKLDTAKKIQTVEEAQSTMDLSDLLLEFAQRVVTVERLSQSLAWMCPHATNQ